MVWPVPVVYTGNAALPPGGAWVGSDQAARRLSGNNKKANRKK